MSDERADAMITHTYVRNTLVNNALLTIAPHKGRITYI